MMMDEERVRGKLLGALNAAKQKQTWTRVLELPDALDELDRWLKDDRQWSAQTRGRHWITLIDDVVAALEALGESVRAVLDVEARVRDLNDCKDPLNADKDVALHRRLSRAAGELAERACSVAALAAAWDDLEAAATTGSTDVERAARCLVSIAEWMGHGADALVDRQLAPHCGARDGVRLTACGTLPMLRPSRSRSLTRSRRCARCSPTHRGAPR